MSYFSKFPLTAISHNNKTYVIQDFLRRVGISDDFRRNVAYLEDYFVRDEETPELVSNLLYGNPTYHWLILILNEIVDVRTEWPIPNNKVSDLIYQKYDYKISVPDETQYSENDVVESDNGGKFIVTKTETGFVFLRSQVGKINILVSTILTNVTKDVTGLTVISVIDPEEAIHHYYDPEVGYIVDENFSLTTVPVTNFDYEIATNDNKRTIKVLSPAVLSYFVKQFDDLIRG